MQKLSLICIRLEMKRSFPFSPPRVLARHLPQHELVNMCICLCVCVFAFVSFLSAQLNSCHFPFTITGTYSLTSTVLKHSHSRCLSLGGGAPPCIARGAADVYCSCLFASVSPPLGSFVHPFLSRPHSSCRSLPSFRFRLSAFSSSHLHRSLFSIKLLSCIPNLSIALPSPLPSLAEPLVITPLSCLPLS